MIKPIFFAFRCKKGHKHCQILSNIVKHLLQHPPSPPHHHCRKQAEDPEQEVDVETLLPANLDENLNRLFFKDEYPNIVIVFFKDTEARRNPHHQYYHIHQ